MRFPIFLAALLFLAPIASAAEPAHDDDAQLIRMETEKWQPSSLLNPVRLLSMFSSEMLSVDYGTDLHGGAARRNWREIIAYGPLPGWKVDLGEWRVLHPTSDVAIVSYKVTGVSIEWKAYATSTWVKRDGAWKTVFYQASAAK